MIYFPLVREILFLWIAKPLSITHLSSSSFPSSPKHFLGDKVSNVQLQSQSNLHINEAILCTLFTSLYGGLNPSYAFFRRDRNTTTQTTVTEVLTDLFLSYIGLETVLINLEIIGLSSSSLVWMSQFKPFYPTGQELYCSYLPYKQKIQSPFFVS